VWGYDVFNCVGVVVGAVLNSGGVSRLQKQGTDEADKQAHEVYSHKSQRTMAKSKVAVVEEEEEYAVKEYVQNITINMNAENQTVVIRQYGVPNNKPPGNTGGGG